MLPFMTPNLFILSVIAPDVVIFSISLLKMSLQFVLALMPFYRAYRFFKPIAWTTSNVEQHLEF